MRHRMPPGHSSATPGTTSRSTDGGAAGAPRPGHRFDVEGLRAVAILLVAGFHVWGDGRVSGGVDVFLLISGFFVGGGLLRRVGGGAPFALGAYVARLGRRLVPPLVLALVAVVVGTWLWLPRSEWSDVSGGVLASATYVENWRMALAGQAYAAADPMSSPVQHIWSLSVQGQLFLALPLLLLAIRFVLRRAGLGDDAARRGLVVAVAALAAASFAWAVVGVRLNQNVAYFDTGARAWEYLVGALVAAAVPVIRLPRLAALALGWLGLAMILATGVVVDARATFPGPEALLPIGGAVLVMVAGLAPPDTRTPSVGRVLGWRPLATAGGYAYEYYLWHWVVLVLALAATGRESFGWLAGSVVLIVSGVVAWLARRMTDYTFSRALGTTNVKRQTWTWAPIATAVTLALIVPGAWTIHRAANPWIGTDALDVVAHPGALSLLDPHRWPDPGPVGFTPPAEDARFDWPLNGRDDCRESDVNDPEVLLCVLGDPSGSTVVALAGSSHAAGFAPALDAVAAEAGVRVEGYFKQGCPLAVRPVDPQAGPDSCAQWNTRLMEILQQGDYHVVLVTGTRDGVELADWDDGDYVPPSYVEAWERLIAGGVPVIAIRNGPTFPVDVPSCVAENGPLSPACRVSRVESLGSDVLTPAVRSELFNAVDLSDGFCGPDDCSPVVGNVLAYIDTVHVTATFSKTVAPLLARELEAAALWP